MHSNKFQVSRRNFLVLTGGAVSSNFFTAFAGSTDIQSIRIPPCFTLFYAPEKTGTIWDTWLYYHEDTFYLYYNPTPKDWTITSGKTPWNGVALATSNDGVHWHERGFVIDPVPNIDWMGAGAVWPSGEKFIMNFSESSGGESGKSSSKQTIFFAESRDLINWQLLDPEHAFNADTQWYHPNGRWDNVWPVPRSQGGYYGYWAAWPKNKKEIGFGFGESDDGITWRARPPALLELKDVLESETDKYHTIEVGAAHFREGKYYVVFGGSLPISSNLTARMMTAISDSAAGPFRIAPKNHRLLVGNASYFLRFAAVGEDILANHQSWEISATYPYDGTSRATLKKVHWDDEGTLRLMWWGKNNLAKEESLPVSLGNQPSGSQPIWLDIHFEPSRILILEGEMLLPDALDTVSVGLYLEGAGNVGTAFLVRKAGAVDYGSMRLDGTGFKREDRVDRELPHVNKVQFRLVRKGRITEFYLNDYLMQCFSLPEGSTGRIGFVGLANKLKKLRAWYCT